MREKRFVYMDHAATTFTKPDVAESMLPFLKEQFGNPSSLYSIGDRKQRGSGESP